MPRTPPTRLSASEPEKDLLFYIMHHLEEKCYQPSHKEMAEQFDVHTDRIAELLRVLVEQNAIVLPTGNTQRALTIKGVKCLIMKAPSSRATTSEGDTRRGK
jgi:SOS-response transcriptional repressor LexA